MGFQRLCRRHTHTLTMDAYTPEGSVASHTHTIPVALLAAEPTTGLLQNVAGALNCTDDTDITPDSVAPAFTGTAKAPTGTISKEVA